MSEKSLEEEREFCRGVYEKWGFIKKIVELYAEGVSWQGCDKLDIESIKGGVRDMLVSGVGQFTLKDGDSVQVPMPQKHYLAEEQPGHPFLWPQVQDAVYLDEIKKALSSDVAAQEMFQYLANNICSGLGVPYTLLTSTATTANWYTIMSWVDIFVGNVNTWREYLRYPLKLTWNNTWSSSGHEGYGKVYQVFKEQGIDFRMLRDESIRLAKSALDSGLISKQIYEEMIRWF